MKSMVSIIAASLIALSGAKAEMSQAPAPAFTVEVTGEGAPVLFIPGLSSGGDVWDGTVASLAGVEAHVVTLAGFAGAAPVEGPFVETRLKALQAYLKAEKLEDVTVVGHSLGGFMAMKLALAEPGRVGRVVIVDSVPFLAQFFLGAASAEAAAPMAGRMRDQLLASSEETYAAQQAGFASMQAASAEAQQKILADSLASDRATTADAFYELLTTDLRAAIGDLRQPMLVLYPWREGGPFTAEQTDGAYAGQYAAAPDKTLKRIDGSAHFIMYDQPEALTGEIERFLKK